MLATGVGARPGAAKGEVVFTAHEAVDAAAEGRDVVLVRPDTNANDVAGFHAAKGILTSLGGKASHAALVARGMGVPCVTAASGLRVDLEARVIRVGDHEIKAGDFIAINGTTGEVTLEDVPLVDPNDDPAFAEILESFETVLGWADDVRRLGVRANADTPGDADKARELGAEGIGLCRTEHMFMAEDRQPKMRAMIMADDRESRKDALAELLPLQQEDFEGLFEAMKGLPVTIRLLDPPLHEFLPDLPDLAAQVERARIECTDDLDELEKLLETTERISEENPMLGTRGCRLGILYPEIYEMQVHAILRAAKAMDEPPHPEIMIPLVDYEQEIEIMRELVVRIGDEEGLHETEDYTVGTMIELPRACFVADLIAKHADFFSFGTNDLTQTALGFSRDDVESKFVPGLHGAQDHRPLAVRDDRQAGRRLARAARGVGRARGAAGPQARHLRRARRRPGLDRVLPHGRARLRVVLAVPRPDRARGGGPGGDHPCPRSFLGGRVKTLCRKCGVAPIRPRSRSECVRVTAPPEPRATSPPPSRRVRRVAVGARHAVVPRAPRARRRPTAGCARRSSATATGSCTARRSGASSTRRRCSSRPRATTTARG